MTSSQRSRELAEEHLLPLYSSAPSSPMNRATAETAVKLLNHERSTPQTPSPPRAANPFSATPEWDNRTQEDIAFEFWPLPCKILAVIGFIFFAIFALAFVIWMASLILKLSWMMLQNAFSAGLPGDSADALNVTEAITTTGASNISVSIP